MALVEILGTKSLTYLVIVEFTFKTCNVLDKQKNKKQQAFTGTTFIMQEKKYATLVRLCSQLKSNKISTSSISTIYTNFYKQSTKVILKIKVWRCKKVPRKWSLGEVAFLEMEE